MTNIELTSAELELIQAKRIEAEAKAKAAADGRAADIAKKTTQAKMQFGLRVQTAKNNLDLMRTNYGAMLAKAKGTTAWKWNTIKKTIEEDVKIWNSEHSRYETIEILSAEIETATLTNRSLKIIMTNNGFASNIWKDRAAKWNPYPKPFISGGYSSKGYSTLKKCITVAEELQAEIDNADAVKTNKLSLQEKATQALRAQYPTADIIAESKWDSHYKKDVPVVKVTLANGIAVILEPYRENVDGSLEYARHSINATKIDNMVILNALNAIRI
jgi:hypothetical protein